MKAAFPRVVPATQRLKPPNPFATIDTPLRAENVYQRTLNRGLGSTIVLPSLMIPQIYEYVRTEPIHDRGLF